MDACMRRISRRQASTSNSKVALIWLFGGRFLLEMICLLVRSSVESQCFQNVAGITNFGLDLVIELSQFERKTQAALLLTKCKHL